MTVGESFFFYDLETFGMCPRRSRIAQFAGIRTNAQLEEIEAPVSFFVKPANDLLPSPAATLVTGITPQRALHEGVNEAEAFARINEIFSQPGTCALGYNTLRFDDEFIRFGLYRNFYEPYDREWRNGNSRADVLDIARLVHALRPDGITWRPREDGLGVSLKLEHLAEDNGLREGAAHEALSDVRATLGLARRIRAAQPRLWEYALRLRAKSHAGGLIDLASHTPLLHVSGRLAATRLGAAPVLPITYHPTRKQTVITFDLTQAPDALLDLDAQQIADRLFTRQDALPEGVERIALKSVHLNKTPMLVNWAHLRAADFERLMIDVAQVERHAAQVRRAGAVLAEKIRQVHTLSQSSSEKNDVDASLYDGFLNAADAPLRARVRTTAPERLASEQFEFRDPRFNELLFRYRARNWPELLSFSEMERWNSYRKRRAQEGVGSEQTLQTYMEDIARLRASHPTADAQQLLDALQHWGQETFDALD